MKNQLPYCKTSEAIKGYETSVIAKNETNDCVVRSIASAFDIEYEESHKFVANTFGRRPRKGAGGFVLGMNKISDEGILIGNKCCTIMGEQFSNSPYYILDYKVKVKGVEVSRKMTVGTFIKQNPKGSYVICVSRHAFTIKDGVIIGNREDAMKKKRIIHFAWKVI
jgi:hypothetical protein